MKRITVLLADDNTFMRKVFRGILDREEDFEVVGEAIDGCQAVAMVKELRPALVLMDLTMPALDGVQATRQILEAVPTTKVLMLSGHHEKEYVEAATTSGAMGYLIKESSLESVCAGIREVYNGNAVFSPSIPAHLHKLSPQTAEH